MSHQPSTPPTKRRLTWVLALVGLVTVVLAGVLLGLSPDEAEVAAPTTVHRPGTTQTSPPEPEEPEAERPEPPLLWQSGFEQADFSDFYDVSPSGCVDHEVVHEPVRSGSYAAALTVCDGEGGVRLRVEDLVPEESLPDNAFYSAWFNMPDTWEGDDANIFQFKQAVTYDGGETQTKEVLFSIQAGWNGDRWELRLKSKIDQETGEWDGKQRVLGDGVAVPAGEWFHVEARYQWSRSGDGIVRVWVNGDRVWSVEDIYTELDWPYKERPRQWTLNNYLNGSDPETNTIYVDDVAVSTERLGPDGLSDPRG